MLEEVPEPARTFVWIRYGDDQRLLVNLYCSFGNLTNFIACKCGLEKDVTFDLCDASGRLLNINDPQAFSQVVYNVEGGGEYILIALNNDKGEHPGEVQPLLNNYDAIYPNLLGLFFE
ncbi:unnamed protein product [Calicophoron daubneyi]|uniref:Uncharacterized protein n=1 Tax=Calicophoron daubneyi TaxID=300641 RepID=A0AAV2TAT4_CALDB